MAVNRCNRFSLFSFSCTLISTSCIHSFGFTLFSLQHPISEKKIAAACAASCDPEKSVFFLFKVNGLIERSTGLLSMQNCASLTYPDSCSKCVHIEHGLGNRRFIDRMSIFLLAPFFQFFDNRVRFFPAKLLPPPPFQMFHSDFLLHGIQSAYLSKCMPCSGRVISFRFHKVAPDVRPAAQMQLSG